MVIPPGGQGSGARERTDAAWSASCSAETGDDDQCYDASIRHEAMALRPVRKANYTEAVFQPGPAPHSIPSKPDWG